MLMFDSWKGTPLSCLPLWVMGGLISSFLWVGGAFSRVGVHEWVLSMVMSLGWSVSRTGWGVRTMSGYVGVIVSLIVMVVGVNLFGFVPGAFSLSCQPGFSMGLAVFLTFSVWASSVSVSWVQCVAGLVPCGCPKVLVMFMVYVEAVSVMVRPITMGLRMTVNLTAGHIILGVLGDMVLNQFLGDWGLTVGGLLMKYISVMCLVGGIIWECFAGIIQAVVFCMILNIYAEFHSR